MADLSRVSLRPGTLPDQIDWPIKPDHLVCKETYPQTLSVQKLPLPCTLKQKFLTPSFSSQRELPFVFLCQHRSWTLLCQKCPFVELPVKGVVLFVLLAGTIGPTSLLTKDSEKEWGQRLPLIPVHD